MGGPSLAALVVSGTRHLAAPRPADGCPCPRRPARGLNDIALQPDPQQLITRTGHLALERRGAEWFLVDGGSVNEDLPPPRRRPRARDGTDAASRRRCRVRPRGRHRPGGRSFFELSFHAAGADSQATRAAPPEHEAACLGYDAAAGRSCWCRTGRGTSSRSERRRTGSSGTWPSGTRPAALPRSAPTVS